MYMAGTRFGHNDISSCRNHYASSPALSKAINSDSIVKRAMHVCLKDFQVTVAPPSIDTYPLVDFDSSEFVIQFASLYLGRGGYFSYLKIYSLVLDT